MVNYVGQGTNETTLCANSKLYWKHWPEKRMLVILCIAAAVFAISSQNTLGFQDENHVV